MNNEAAFSVWCDTQAGDLFTVGTSAGRALTREKAWEVAQNFRKAAPGNMGNDYSFVRVYRGCTLVWSSFRLSDGTWTAGTATGK